jgi:hypothetical protein
VKSNSSSVSAGNLTKEQYEKYRSLTKAKSWKLSASDKEDVFHDLCEDALKTVAKGSMDSVDKAVSSQVFWKTGRKSQARRNQVQQEIAQDPTLLSLNVARRQSSQRLDAMSKSLADLPENTLTKFCNIERESEGINAVLDGLVAQLRQDNAAKIVSVLRQSIPDHLMNAFTLRTEGHSYARIGQELGIPKGNAQYFCEEALRRAQKLVKDMGLSSLTDLENNNFRLVA